ncbi:hypothetical protein ACAW74_25990 [Fibrella sp. WM1]|uniref:hypothetical protein n=1 Tax=Fibrella musci TaxID=3242485 RepID=UPI003521C6D0
MKYLYLLTLCGLTSCMQLGQKIAATHPNSTIRTPSSIPEAVGQVVEVKRTVDAYGDQKRQQTQEAKEAQYAAIQEREQLQAGYTEMRTNYLTLREELNALKTQLTDLRQENGNLRSQLATLNVQVENLKSNEVLLRQTLIVLTDRPKEQPTVTPKPAPVKPVEPVVSMGEVEVTDSPVTRQSSGSSSSRKASVYSYSSPSTSYTPRAAPVRRAQQVYHLGPRGGCYYWTNSGRKEYVDRSLCH